MLRDSRKNANWAALSQPRRADEVQKSHGAATNRGENEAKTRPAMVVVTPFAPLPDESGGAERTRVLLNGLAKAHDVDLVTFARDPRSVEAAKARGVFAGLRRVVVVPHLAEFRALPFALEPERSGPFESRVMRELLMSMTRRHNYDLALVEHAELARYGAVLRAGRRVLLMHELPTLRVVSEAVASGARGGAKRGGAAPSLHGAIGAFGQWARWNVALRHWLSAYDAVIALTEVERQALQRLAPPSVRCVFTPTGVEEASFDGATQFDVGFAGNYAHAPNRDAALRLVREVLPRLREKRPLVTVAVTGHHLDSALRESLTREAGVTVVPTPLAGAMPAFYASVRVLVSPTEEGAGVRIKHLHALAAGTPVVTTVRGGWGLCEVLETASVAPERRAALAVCGSIDEMVHAVERRLAASTLEAAAMRRYAVELARVFTVERMVGATIAACFASRETDAELR